MRHTLNLTLFFVSFTFLSIISIWWIVPAVAQVTFDHQAHLQNIDDQECETCHVADARSIVPEQQACLQCHDAAFLQNVVMPGTATHGPLWGLEHRPFAKGAQSDCASCHQQSDCLKCHQAGVADEMGDFGNTLANVHRSDFQVSHPIAARTDPQLCSSCHENDFCVDCHNAFAPADLALDSHRRGWSDLSVGAASHADFDETTCDSCHSGSVLPSHDWSARHGREARKNLATCQACHPNGDICLTCHSATTGLRVNPHSKDWNEFSERLERASDGKTCRKCH
ncbi:MAG: cytochrome C [Desulfuromonas sp.]|nr:MAG: cytochrome C [Desulfuromonas sp.]